MRKKLVAMVLIGMMALSMTACGSSSNSEKSNAKKDNAKETTKSSEPKKEPEKEPEKEDDGIIDFTTDKYNVKYVRYETGTDYEGNPCLLYYYTFTNNGDENASPMSTAYIQCFQNGVECDTATILDENESVTNYMKEVQPGGSMEVCQVYSLKDTSEITIEASDLISFDDEKDTQKIALQ